VSRSAVIPVKKKVYPALFEALTVPFFLRVPQGTKYPYATFGQVDETPWETKTSTGSFVSYKFDVYSEDLGSDEAQQAVDEIVSTLVHKSLDLSADNFRLIETDLEVNTVVTESFGDLELEHGIVMVEFRVHDLT
jgi:hypothetical protein